MKGENPMNWMRMGVVAAALAGVVGSAEAAYEKEGRAPIRKKYVAFGWEFGQATPDQLLKVADSLDRTALDGIGIYLNVTNAAGKRVNKMIMHAPAYDWNDLAPSVPAFRALTRHRSMKETFFKSFCAPTNRLDWADDATWARIGMSMRMLARLAKAGGLKGLSVDDEDYHHQRLFRRLPGEPSMDVMAELVRRRAREVFAPAFEEYPEMTVFLFRFFTAGRIYSGCNDPMGARADTGDLWPSFLNGLLDVLPPGAKLVDGYEESYVFDSLKHEYLRGYMHEKSRLVNMATPSNRIKYLTQVSGSMAIYLDMYRNPEGSKYYSTPIDGSRFAHLAANLEQVTQTVDEYVWFWGEKQCWSDWSAAGRKLPRNIKPERWTQSFPELTDTMEILKDPAGFAARQLEAIRAAGAFKPLNANAACERPSQAKDDKLSAPYSGWSDKNVGPEGRFFFDSTVGENDTSSLCAEGVAGGCITMSIRNLKAGDAYLAGFSAKGKMTSGMIYWLRNGKWDFNIPGISVSLSAPDANGWKHGLMSFRIPPEADGFGMQMGVCQAPGEKCWFDNAFYLKAR